MPHCSRVRLNISSSIVGDRYRRIFLVAATSGEGLLTERITASQRWRHELAVLPNADCRRCGIEWLTGVEAV